MFNINSHEALELQIIVISVACKSFLELYVILSLVSALISCTLYDLASQPQSVIAQSCNSHINLQAELFNPLWIKRNRFYLKTQFVPSSKHFTSG